METEARTIGELLPATTTPATDLSAPATRSFSDLDLTVLQNLPPRLSDALLATVQEIANCPLPAVVACDEDHFAKCIRSLATLPRRAGDDVSGKLRLGLYHAKLGGFSNEALSHLVSKALETCTFFPTIAECLTLLKGWDSRQTAIAARNKAETAIRAERQIRMEETMQALERGDLDGDAIAALPEGILRIAETRALVWNDGDGKYRPRPNREMAEIRARGQHGLGL